MAQRIGRALGRSNNGFKRKKDCDGNVAEAPEDLPDQQQQQPPVRKKRKEVAIFGNYRSYYGYRVDRDVDEDPRLRAMKREWFEDKDCLDIGCNSGLITIAIARKFGCRRILGVDIDGARINDAHWELQKVAKMSVHHRSDDADVVKQVADKREKSGSFPEKDFLKVVYFQRGNFVQNWQPPTGTCYHAILCLSVSKWVHLNWGDDGLITLFWRAWKLLSPGGVFILEPQPWSSYHSNRKVSEVAASNYKTIQIRPEDFQEILLDKIGFRRVESINSAVFGAKVGFDRPILAFWK